MIHYMRVGEFHITLDDSCARQKGWSESEIRTAIDAVAVALSGGASPPSQLDVQSDMRALERERDMLRELLELAWNAK